MKENKIARLRVENKANKTQPKELEWHHAVSFVKWCTLHGIFVVHLANEGLRKSVTGSLLKRMGLVSGIPDFLYPESRGGYGSLWIELKRNKTYTPSERKKETWIKQEMTMIKLREMGNKANFAFGWEEAVQQLTDYMKLPLNHN